MKRQLSIIIPVLALITSCKGQNITSAKVPSVVLNTLKSKFPTANDIDWEKPGNIYEAEFDLNDSTEISIQIDEAGRLLLQKHDIQNSDFSSLIALKIQQQYKGYKIEDVEKLEKDGTTYYQVELKGKGKKDRNLVFSSDGNEINNIPFWD